MNLLCIVDKNSSIFQSDELEAASRPERAYSLVYVVVKHPSGRTVPLTLLGPKFSRFMETAEHRIRFQVMIKATQLIPTLNSFAST